MNNSIAKSMDGVIVRPYTSAKAHTYTSNAHETHYLGIAPTYTAPLSGGGVIARFISFGKTMVKGFSNIFTLFLLSLVVFLIILLKSETASQFFTDPFLLIYTFSVTTFQLSRVAGAALFVRTKKLLARTYTDDGTYEPSITFVIPCKDEEASIEKTIHMCFMAQYPKDKVEVIVINDGSSDNTGPILESLKSTYQDRMYTVVHWKQNKGKRHGMAEGFKRATGEIIIQLDSDSYIDPSTIRAFIAPFQNKKIGAICAHADPENADENLLTKMQAGYYFMSFRILKAAESTFASVFCCSGCSSAYRRSVVMPIIDDWLKEEFLGLPVTWGDDRALTNWVIKRGYSTI